MFSLILFQKNEKIKTNYWFQNSWLLQSFNKQFKKAFEQKSAWNCTKMDILYTHEVLTSSHQDELNFIPTCNKKNYWHAIYMQTYLLCQCSYCAEVQTPQPFDEEYFSTR